MTNGRQASPASIRAPCPRPRHPPPAAPCCSTAPSPAPCAEGSEIWAKRQSQRHPAVVASSTSKPELKTGSDHNLRKVLLAEPAEGCLAHTTSVVSRVYTNRCNARMMLCDVRRNSWTGVQKLQRLSRTRRVHKPRMGQEKQSELSEVQARRAKRQQAKSS